MNHWLHHQLAALLSYLQQGGSVMWPLLLCCFAMLYLAAGMLFSQSADKLPSHTTNGELGWLEQRLDKLNLESALWHQQGQLQAITLLATTAPLLGLLGTVNGMITMFSALSYTGLHDGKALSDGVAMAMITTQTGLLIGAPGLLMAFLWRRRLAKTRHQWARLSCPTTSEPHHVK